MAYDYIVKVGADVDDITKNIMSALGSIDKDAKIKVKCDDSDIKRVVKAMSSVDKIAAKRITLDVKGDGVYKTLAEIRKETQETVDSMKKEFDTLSTKNLDEELSKNNNLLAKRKKITNTFKTAKSANTFFQNVIDNLNSKNLDKNSDEYLNEAAYIIRHINAVTTTKKYKLDDSVLRFKNENIKEVLDAYKMNKPGERFKIDYSDEISAFENQIKILEEQKARFENLKKELEEYKALGIVPGGNFGSDDYTGTGSGSGSGGGIENAEKLAEILEQIKKTLGSIDGESGLKDVLACINEISVSLESMRKVISDVGEGQKFSPLLSALDELKNGISLNSFGEESGIKGFLESIESIKESFLAVKSIIADVGDGSELSPLLSKIQEISDAINKLAEATNVYGKFAARYYLDKVDETKNKQKNNQNGQTSKAKNGKSTNSSSGNGTTAADKAKAIKEETKKILDAVESENQELKSVVGRFDSEYDDNSKNFNDTLNGTSISTKRDTGKEIEHTKYTVGYNSTEDKVVVKKDVRADRIEKEKEAQKELNSLVDEYIEKQKIINSTDASSGIDVGKLQSELNNLEQNIFKKLSNYQENGIITKEASLSFTDNFYKTTEENTKKDIYSSLIADTQEYIKWLKVEANATGKAKEEAIAHVQALEKSIAAKKSFIKQTGLSDDKSDIKIQEMNDKATGEINFKNTDIANKEALKEINELLDDYLEKSNKVTSVENAFSDVGNKIDKSELKSSRNKSRKKLNKKLNKSLQKGIITQEDYDSIISKKNEQEDKNLQKNTYSAINSKIQEYIKLLKEEGSATGDIKEKIAGLREEIELYIQSKRKMLEGKGLSDVDEELKIDEKILKAQREIDLEKFKSQDKQNKQSEEDSYEFAGRSYNRQTKLVEEKNKLELKNVNASESEKAANNVRIEAIKEQIKLEEEYRNALNLSNANDEARTRLLNAQIKARNELNIEEMAYTEKLKKEDEIAKKKETEKKAATEKQNSKYNSEDVGIFKELLADTVLDDGSGGNATFSKLGKFDSSGKGTIVFIEELDGKVRETTVHVEDLNDALDRIKDDKFSSTGLKTDFKEKDVKEPESNVSSKKVQKDVLSLKSSFTNAFKGDDFALQTFMSTIERIRTEYKELSDMKLKGLMDEAELSNFKELEEYLNSLTSVLKENTLGKFNANDFVPKVQGKFENAEKSFKEIEEIFKRIQNGELISDEDINRIRTFAKEAQNLYKDMSKEENMLAEDGSVNKLKKRIATALNENTKHTPEMNKFREELKKLQNDVAEGMPLTKFKEDGATLEKILAGIEDSGKGGLSVFGKVKEKIKGISHSFIAYYFSLMDIIRYVRNGLTTIKELDTAFTEMRKVSNESVDSLKKFQKESFATASAVGTTAQQIQNSTADWMNFCPVIW